MLGMAVQALPSSLARKSRRLPVRQGISLLQVEYAGVLPPSSLGCPCRPPFTLLLIEKSANRDAEGVPP